MGDFWLFLEIAFVAMMPVLFVETLSCFVLVSYNVDLDENRLKPHIKTWSVHLQNNHHYIWTLHQCANQQHVKARLGMIQSDLLACI